MSIDSKLLKSAGNAGFRFGLEAEYMVADCTTFRPLWHDELSFRELNACMESIRLDDLPSMAGLDLEAPHRKIMPYVVEGYHVKEELDGQFHSIDMLPKGVEIRTPVCDSLEQCLKVFEILHHRLDAALALRGYASVAISHHPIATQFEGPQYNRRYDFWQLAMEVMTTFGPDVNVSFPDSIAEHLDQAQLLSKINHYGPAMTALSVASPFYNGELWKVRGKVGKSFRTHKRSVIAQPIEFHPHEKNRMEFKVFEMTNRTDDFRNYFLLFLTLVLDDQLKGRASAASRIYDLGAVARYGLHAEEMRERAEELITSAQRTLPRWGFDPASLESFATRVDTGRTPADLMIEWYQDAGSIAPVMKKLSQLETLHPGFLQSTPLASTA